MMTCGRDANHVYLQVVGIGDEHGAITGHGQPAHRHGHPQGRPGPGTRTADSSDNLAGLDNDLPLLVLAATAHAAGIPRLPSPATQLSSRPLRHEAQAFAAAGVRGPHHPSHRTSIRRPETERSPNGVELERPEGLRPPTTVIDQVRDIATPPSFRMSAGAARDRHPRRGAVVCQPLPGRFIPPTMTQQTVFRHAGVVI